MRSIRSHSGTALIWAMAMAGPLAASAARSQEPSDPRGRDGVAVEPSEIVAGMFYTGTTVRVSAIVPAGTRVAVICRGQTHPVVLKRKGKVLGLIWMNVADVSFPAVPDLYLLQTSAPVASLAPRAVVEDLTLGFDALAARSAPEPGRASLFGELVRLKQREGLWAVVEGGVHVQEGGDARTALATTDFRLPVRAPPGVYQVQVHAFDDDGSTLVGSADVRIVQGGVAGFFTTMAARHGLLYGIMATVIAMATGLLTGLTFGLAAKRGR